MYKALIGSIYNKKIGGTETSFGGQINAIKDFLGKTKSVKGAAGGGTLMPKQKPINPRVDPRGALPMNTMMNRGIAGLAKPNMKRK